MVEFDVTYDEYYGGKFEIAREGEWGYDTDGYIALVKNGKAALVHASHCSCYGTWDGPSDTPPWEWTGTVDELVALAERRGDPAGMLDRPLDPEKDYGVRDLLAVYAQVLDWNNRGRK